MHKASKLILGGSSKSYKTWALTDLAVSVATGTPWLNLPTCQGKVLYVNLEIQAPFFRDWLTWAGVEDVTEVRFGPNIATADADAAREVATAQTRQVAKTF